jgi:peptide/nickel transport system substrate-binding protein
LGATVNSARLVEGLMRTLVKVARLIVAILAGLAIAGPVLAQKSGGVLRVSHRDSPASLSILEELTVSSEAPAMGVMNNLVMFKQDVPQNTMESIVPDLAESWSWNADRTALTFKLHQGVKWHDGKPFTAADVKCTFDLILGRGKDRLRLNPRRAWYNNLDEVIVEGDHQTTFKLKRPQPAFIVLLASGFSPVYPCHISAQQMRQNPIGTGPFKFVEYKPNESIKFVRNLDYWKPGRPYLDGIEYTIITNRSTAILAFVTGKFDMTFPYELQVPLMKDLQSQDPTAICELRPTNVSRNLIVNPTVPPFDKPEIRRAMAMTLDRKAFIDIISDGKADVGAAMLPPPEGIWGLPPEELAKLPGYEPDVAKARAAARKIMEALGYGPENRIKTKVSTRNIAQYRDPAVLLIDQLKEIYIDAELEPIDTANWFPKVIRKDFVIGLNLTGSGLDDPDQNFYENYVCGADKNYTGYCDKEFDRLVDQQSMESDQVKRKEIVWQIERKLAAGMEYAQSSSMDVPARAGNLG